MAFREGVLVFRQAGALPPAVLEDLIGQIRGLDMDDVRRQMAEHDHDHHDHDHDHHDHDHDGHHHH